MRCSGSPFFVTFVAVDKSTSLTNEQLLALRARNGHVRLVEGEMDLITPRTERAGTRFAKEGLLTETAPDHVEFHS
jgi:hypothetical protein